jgi:uncharacterized Zn finger protein
MLPINLASIRANATPQSFARGESYLRSGAVSTLSQRGSCLHSQIVGSEPYTVGVEFDGMGITAVHCSCPYDLDGWCQHIVAVLLACLEQPDAITIRPTLAELLDGLTLSQTRQALLDLADDDPIWVDDFERQVNASVDQQPSGVRSALDSVLDSVFDPLSDDRPIHRRPSVSDSEPFRQRAKQVLHDAVEAWENGEHDDSITEDLLEIVAKAEEFINGGDSASAIVMLSGLTQGCVEDWNCVDHYGADDDEIGVALNLVWAEAMLSADLSAAVAEKLRSDFLVWQDSWSDFSLALEALDQGWQYPPLQQVLRGEITDRGAWSGEAPDFADDLALVRLRILARQGRFQEYLYLAEAEGQIEQYQAMLAQVGVTAAPPDRDPTEGLFAQVEGDLAAGQFDRAMAAVADLEDGALVRRVMAAVMVTHSNWVIQQATDRAAAIINSGQSAAYGQAIEWLRQVKATYGQADRQVEWAHYHGQLIAVHARKRKLVGLLQELGVR